MGKFKDLTNQRFGRLTVIKQTDSYVYSSGRKDVRWLCKCDCGNVISVRTCSLNSGNTQSCGCLSKEITATKGKKHKKYNHFEFKDDYVIGYTRKGDQFYIDLEDYEKVKDVCWYYNKENIGYIVGKRNGECVRLHRLIMGLDKNDKRVVDHINHNTLDNRKSNLRIVDRSQNAMNRVIRTNNKSGVPGVYYRKQESLWIASISINKINMVVGRFKNFKDAVAARKEAENKYYAEYSYSNSQKYALNNSINKDLEGDANE